MMEWYNMLRDLETDNEIMKKQIETLKHKISALHDAKRSGYNSGEAMRELFKEIGK